MGGKWEQGSRGDSAGDDWLKAPKSSSKSLLESATSITLVVSSSGAGFEEVASSLRAS